MCLQRSVRRHKTNLHCLLERGHGFVDWPSLRFLSSQFSQTLERSPVPFLPACRCTGSLSQCSSPRACWASQARTVALPCASRECRHSLACSLLCPSLSFPRAHPFCWVCSSLTSVGYALSFLLGISRNSISVFLRAIFLMILRFSISTVLTTCLTSSITSFWSSCFSDSTSTILFPRTDLRVLVCGVIHRDRVNPVHCLLVFPAVRRVSRHATLPFELCPLPGVATCECVPRAPNSDHLCNVRPWFRQGLGCLDELLARPHADPRVLLRMLTIACCAWSAGLTNTTLSPSARCAWRSFTLSPELGWQPCHRHGRGFRRAACGPLLCVAGNALSLEPPPRRTVPQTSICTFHRASHCFVSRDGALWSLCTGSRPHRHPGQVANLSTDAIVLCVFRFGFQGAQHGPRVQF